jgi:hypothetical protein
MELGPVLTERQWTERIVTTVPDGHFGNVQGQLIEEHLDWAETGWRFEAWVPVSVRLSESESERLLSQLMTDRAESPP